MNGSQSIAYISQLGTGYAPIATGLQPNYASAFEGLPIPGGQQFAPLLMMALGPQFQGLMARSGMVGMGLGHDQNVYDRIMAQNYQNQMQTQIRNASELDRSNYMQTMQGISSLFGVPFGGQQRLAANRLADLAVNYAPIMAQVAPELLDQLSGSRGSAAVLGQRIGNAGRYRLDPVTGRMGMSAESVQNVTKNIMDDLYSPENIASMKGVSAGQLGGLYEQLSLRGMVAGSEYGYMGTLRNLQGAMAPQELLQRANQLGVKGIKEVGGKLDLSGVSASDLDILTKDDAVTQKLRDFDANRVKSSLKSYVSAISAMRDIFGDAGQPNAPIPELMRALEGLSTGSMGQVDPQRLGQMVRQTYYLAKSGGISADAAGLMQQDAAVRGQQLGIEAPFAMLATQNSLAYNTALRSRGVLATPVFGGMSEAQLTQMNTSLVQQGVASNFGTRLGTLLRMQDLLGSDVTKNTDLGTVLNAVRTNQKEATLADGRTVSIANLTAKDVEDLGASAGMGRGDVQNMLRQTQTAREALFKNPNAVNYIREIAQPAEITQQFTQGTTMALQSAVRQNFGITDKNVLNALGGVSNQIMQDLMASPDAVTADTATRTQAIAGMLQNMLPQEVKDKMFTGKSEEEQRAALLGLASNVSGNLDVIAKQRTGAGNFANARRVMDPSLLAEGSARQATESLRNMTRESLAGLSSGSALRRAVDAVQGVDIADPKAFEKVIAQSFGGVYDKRIGDALREPMTKLATARKELDDMLGVINREPDQNKRRSLMESYRTKNQQIESLVNDVRKAGEAVNAYSATGLTQGDVKAAQDSSKAAQLAVRNVSVALADDMQISPAQREAMRKRMPEKDGKPVTDAAVDAAIIAERRKTKAVSNEDIENLMKKEGLTREEATARAQAENAAQRIGISDEAITAQMKAKGFKSKEDAIYSLIDERRLKDPKELETRRTAFEKSSDAARYRDVVRGANLDVQNIITRALDPTTIRSMGVGVAQQARELQTLAQQRQNLIDKYGGSESKFMTTASKDEIAEYNRLGASISTIQDRFAETVKAGGPSEADRKTAREREALRMLGRSSVADLKDDAERKQYEQRVADLAAGEKLTADDAKLIDIYNRRDASGKLSEEGKTKLADVAKRLNVSVEDLGRIRGVSKDVEYEASKDKELLTATPQVLAERLKTSFGLDEQSVTALTATLGSQGARQRAAQLVGTQERLSATAAKGGAADVNELRTAYDRALQSGDMTEFRRKYQLTDTQDFERTVADITASRDADKFRGQEGSKNLAESLKTYGDSMVKSSREPTEVAMTGTLSGEFKLSEGNTLTASDITLTGRGTSAA